MTRTRITNPVITMFAALVVAVAGLTLATGGTAHAAYTDCNIHGTGFDASAHNATDGYLVHDSTLVFRLASGPAACTQAYVGQGTDCASYRIHRYWDQSFNNGQGAYNDAYGAWVYSCWTPVALNSVYGGWLATGDMYFLQYWDGSSQGGGVPWTHEWDR
jgi:hypothetical protein